MDALEPLLAPLASLPGVGPHTARRLERVCGGPRVLDLLFHLPDGYVDRRSAATIADATPGGVVTIEAEVIKIDSPARGSRQPWRVLMQDLTGFAEVALWEKPPPLFMPGARLAVSGKLDVFGARKQLRDPRAVPAEQRASLMQLEPVWPLTEGLKQPRVASAMVLALARVPDLPEWHDPALLRREGWPSFRDALFAVQSPAVLPGDAPRARLAYDELLAHQLALARMRARDRLVPGRALVGDGALRAAALARFGHTPTASQLRAVQEIDADLAAPRRMLRLLQGDVGSGKTLVALMAMLRAVEAGHQAALMAPTEILAQQHHRTLTALAPVPTALLTGSVKGTTRRNVLLGLANGRIKLIVGTHALFQAAVQFHGLALVVIDEQHRFGVDQRLGLGAKGENTDVLVMTATPIPRTLLLTQWNEMAVSRLTEKPAGRRPIRTTIHSMATSEDVIAAIGRALDRGERAYWVCPMVSESAKTDLAAAEVRYATLHARFGARVGLAHGQQEPGVRDRALADFARGDIQLLVATTVIEVGVDVPEASVMVVEHAERFGLAQLHQLRGRVGRSDVQSFCLLLHEDGLSDTMRRRLLMLRETDDGFTIADEDFRIRGGGDLLGRQQSGLVGFRLKFVNAPGVVSSDDALLPTQVREQRGDNGSGLARYERLIAISVKDAALVLERDPDLAARRGLALTSLLRLFGRDQEAELLAAG